MEIAIQQEEGSLRVCAIIPAFNEAKTIAEIVRETSKHVDRVFVVDDGSVDGTAEVARQNGAEVIQHVVNCGPGAALQSGCDAAMLNRFDYVVQVDGDGQHNPKYIPEMLKVARECDMVIASRFLNHSHQSYPLVRRVGIPFFTYVVNLLTHAGITDITSGYRVYRTQSLHRLSRAPNRHWAVAQTMEAAKKGFRIKDVSIEMPLRNAGKSQFSLTRYGLYPIRMTWAILKVILFK